MSNGRQGQHLCKETTLDSQMPEMSLCPSCRGSDQAQNQTEGRGDLGREIWTQRGRSPSFVTIGLVTSGLSLQVRVPMNTGVAGHGQLKVISWPLSCVIL